MHLWHYWGGTVNERVEIEQSNGITRFENRASAGYATIWVPAPQEEVQIIASRLWRDYFEENAAGVLVEQNGLIFNFNSLQAGTSPAQGQRETGRRFRRCVAMAEKTEGQRSGRGNPVGSGDRSARARGGTLPRRDNRFQAAHSNNANIKAAIVQKIANRTGKPRQL